MVVAYRTLKLWSIFVYFVELGKGIPLPIIMIELKQQFKGISTGELLDRVELSKKNGNMTIPIYITTHFHLN